MRPVRMISLAALLVAAVASCSSSGVRSNRPGVVNVVAAENFWGDIASQLGGVHATVTSIITDPTADPHQYESDARTAAEVADARLVIVNGLGYDDFVGKLLSNTSNAGRDVLTMADAMHVSGTDANPHIWYDVPRVEMAANAIELALASADPADGTYFAARYQSFVTSIRPLFRSIVEISHKYRGTPVAYTERVPEYLVRQAQLTVATPAGFARAIEDGVEPSAGDTQAMNRLISGHRIRVLLYNAQATSSVTQHVQDLARQAGIPVVAVTETMPKNEPSYQAWQQHQLEALSSALGG